jgi:Pectate lyase superfamily protein
MRTWIVFFLLVFHSAADAATILSQGARNVKNAVAYGGVSAVGDGVTDDTQAFLDAFNLGRGLGPQGGSPTTHYASSIVVYVPPGNYLVKKQLIPWGAISLIGEPSNPPTITLAANSITTGIPQPFICSRTSYGHCAYDTNWDSANNATYAGSYNNFLSFYSNINFTVLPGNTACAAVLEWTTAQATALRNCVLTGTSSQLACLWTRPGPDGEAGGGGAIQNVTCNGCPTATLQNSVFERLFRGCTFNGAVTIIGTTNTISFIACRFNNPGGAGFNMQSNPLLTLDDCVFAPNTPFHPGGANTHVENISLGTANTTPTLPAGVTAQWTSANVNYKGVSESGTSPNLVGGIKGTPYLNPAYPVPSAACVNVTTFGAVGNGSTDCTTAIRNALAASNEIYFPPGNYKTTGTITLSAGQKIFGDGTFIASISGTSNPVLSVTGRGLAGVVLQGVEIQQLNAGIPCMNWNGDQSSLIIDADFGNNNTSSAALVNFQSGGAFWENSFTAVFSKNTVRTCAVITSTDPLYMFAVDPQHFTGTTYILNNAQNVYMRECTFEVLDAFTDTSCIAITGGSKINIGGLCLAVRGSATPTNGVSISNAQVSLWETSMNAYGTAIISDGAFRAGIGGTGRNFQAVDGYVQ